MLTRALLIAVCGLAFSQISRAEPARTFMLDSNNMKTLHLDSNTGPMRTMLTRENKYPEVGEAELGGFFKHDEMDNNDRDSFGVYGRYGFFDNMTIEAGVPVVDSEFSGESNTGLGDVELKLDLLAFQDIFRYPFIIPHLDVTFPTGDEDEGLGTGETVINFGVSVGTKVYDALTYVVDLSYAFNGATEDYDDENIFMISGSLVWDISDRFAVLAEGRIYEENIFDNYPYQYQGGLAYRITEDVQIAGYGGQYYSENDEEGKFNLAAARLSVQF